MPIRNRVWAAEDRLDWETARRIWSEIYDSDREDREALLGLARALRKLGRISEAQDVLRLAPEHHASHLDYALSFAETAPSDHTASGEPIEGELAVLRRFSDQVYGYAASAVLLTAADCHEQATAVVRMGRHCFGDAFEQLMHDVDGVLPDMHRAIARKDWADAAAAIARVRAGAPGEQEFLAGLADLDLIVDGAIGLQDVEDPEALPPHEGETEAAIAVPAEMVRPASGQALPARRDGMVRQSHEVLPRTRDRRLGRGLAMGAVGLTLVGVVATRIGFDSETRSVPTARSAPAQRPIVTLIPPPLPQTAHLISRTDNVVVAVARPVSTPGIQPSQPAPRIAKLAQVPPGTETPALAKTQPVEAAPAEEPIHITVQYGSGDAGAVDRAARLLTRLRGQGMLVAGPIALDRPVEQSQIGYCFAQDRPVADRLAQLLLSNHAAPDLLASQDGTLARPGEISITIGDHDHPILDPPASGKQT